VIIDFFLQVNKALMSTNPLCAGKAAWTAATPQKSSPARQVPTRTKTR